MQEKINKCKESVESIEKDHYQQDFYRRYFFLPFRYENILKTSCCTCYTFRFNSKINTEARRLFWSLSRTLGSHFLKMFILFALVKAP